MPQNRDFKRLVRTRMQKTGESYTAARSQLLRKKTTSVAPKPAPTIDVSRAGIGDDAVRAKTGKSWAEWVEALDAIGAAKMPHRDIAQKLHETWGVPSWWTQTVTVGYERIRGLRDVGQRRDGGYEASKSKTLPVPLATLYRAWSDARTRTRWLPGVAMKIRKATAEKTLRITWSDDTSVEVYFVAKGAEKSQVAVQHRKLASKAQADAQRTFWSDRLQALAAMLGAKSRTRKR